MTNTAARIATSDLTVGTRIHMGVQNWTVTLCEKQERGGRYLVHFDGDDGRLFGGTYGGRTKWLLV